MPPRPPACLLACLSKHDSRGPHVTPHLLIAPQKGPSWRRRWWSWTRRCGRTLGSATSPGSTRGGAASTAGSRTRGGAPGFCLGACRGAARAPLCPRLRRRPARLTRARRCCAPTPPPRRRSARMLADDARSGVISYLSVYKGSEGDKAKLGMGNNRCGGGGGRGHRGEAAIPAAAAVSWRRRHPLPAGRPLIESAPRRPQAPLAGARARGAGGSLARGARVHCGALARCRAGATVAGCGGPPFGPLPRRAGFKPHPFPLPSLLLRPPAHPAAAGAAGRPFQRGRGPAAALHPGRGAHGGPAAQLGRG
jgi:hypothetical protein